MQRYRFTTLLFLLTGAALFPREAKSNILVGLDPATALYDSDVKGIVNDNNTAGSQSGIPVLGDTEHARGLTFHISFTPNAADLDRQSPNIHRTVLLIEIGGSSNGFGLYLIDGVPTVLSKQNSNDATVPASLNDTSLPAIAVQSGLGRLNADTAYSFSASWNHKGTLELKVQPDEGSIIIDSFAISGTPSNWSGNDTLSVKNLPTGGAGGGLAGSSNVLGPPFDLHDAASFSGTVGRAIFWNESSVTPPTPTAPVVLGFESTSLPAASQTRVHWRVSEGGAPSPTTVVIEANGSPVHTTSTLSGFIDLPGSPGPFTLRAANSNGVTTRETQVHPDTAFGAVVRADLPTAWFRFNEAQGSLLIVDSSENSSPHNGSIFGQPVTGQTSFVDGIATFDGGSGILTDTILNPANLSYGFSIEAVIRRDPGISGANPVVVAQRGSTGRFLLSSSADGKFLTDIGGGQVKHSDGLLHDEQWAHVAVVFDKITPEVRWYLDGVQVGSSSDGVNPDGSAFNPNFTIESATEQWVIGLGKGLTGNYWKGAIDEIAIYPKLLDDPNGDRDRADSRIAAHRQAWWSETSGILEYSSSASDVNAGDPVQLTVKLGADVTSAEISPEVGTLTLQDGNVIVTVHPQNPTTTYELTAVTPSGPLTRSITITARQYQAPVVHAFVVTRLHQDQLRLHWKVSEGEAPNPTELSFSDGETIVHTTSQLEGFFDVPSTSVDTITLAATNATGVTTLERSLDPENQFSSIVREDHPIAWFRFNEPAHSPFFVDSASNAAPHNGRPHGSPLGGVQGIVDGAIRLNGDSAVVSNFILNPGQLDPGLTIEAVIRRDPASGTLNRAIVSQADLNGTGRVLLSTSDDGAPRTYLGQGVRKEADVILPAETWAHLVAVIDALHTEVRWYLDGEWIGTTKDGVNPDGSTFNPNFAFEASQGVWNIGAHKSLASDLWKGEIDEVAIYPHLLDDPDADGDTTDSRIGAHRQAWWSETSGILRLTSSHSSIQAGNSAELTLKTGPDFDQVTISPGIGTISLVDGKATVTLQPATTTTYELVFSGSGGTETRTITIEVTPDTPPRIVRTSLQETDLVIDFTGSPSTTYVIRASANLTNFDEEVGTVATDSSGNGTAIVPINPESLTRKFFRIEDTP